jgi:hypothetical protein
MPEQAFLFFLQPRDEATARLSPVFTLDFSASRTVRNKFLFFTTYPGSSVLLQKHKPDVKRGFIALSSPARLFHYVKELLG